MSSDRSILLVSCYELGHPSWSIALASTLLKNAGYLTTGVDLSIEPLDDHTVRQARWVAIVVPMHAALRIGVKAAQYIRKLNRSTKICFAGTYAELNRQFLLDTVADQVLSGEWEQALVDWVHGVAVPTSPVLERLSFVTPDRGPTLKLERHSHLVVGQEKRTAGYVETSRGCKHLCRHCPLPPVYRGRFFAVPVDVVLQDIARQVALGARHVTFGDPDFLNGPEHARRVAKALHDAFPEITFDATAKVQHIVQQDGEFFATLRLQGLLFLVTAVESLSDPVLQILDKNHTRHDIDQALHLLDSARVSMRPSFVPFTPWETIDGYCDILEWVSRNDLISQIDPIQFAVRLLVPPGSLLLQHPSMLPHLGALDAENFCYGWTHPDPHMDALYAEVSVVVEKAAVEKSPAEETFTRVCHLAFSRAGRVPLALPKLEFRRAPTPRLSEPWFC